MDAYEIGRPQQFIQRHQAHVELLGAIRRHRGVVGDNLHLQALGALGDLGTDVAQPDQAQHLAPDLDAGELGTRPLAALDGSVGLGDVAGQSEEEADRVLGRRDDVAAWRVDDQDALGRGRRHVDVVDSDASPAYHSQALAGIQDPRRDAGLAAHHQRVELRHQLDQLVLALLGAHLDLAQSAQPRNSVLS